VDGTTGQITLVFDFKKSEVRNSPGVDPRGLRMPDPIVRSGTAILLSQPPIR